MTKRLRPTFDEAVACLLVNGVAEVVSSRVTFYTVTAEQERTGTTSPHNRIIRTAAKLEA